ncbi:MAG: nucleotidyltransferase domain-containing protein [Bacteroidetes bacterium]|jgi:predicted nucleotidyltransferase|nr:nucleotidyltransferase domain-containing protein [Bacteroidota bacterium]MDF1867777.1 nucleotidyltransferase domain-containing protein [Saprospiraceae bacterium]
MKKEILALLEKVEKEKNIEILYACESGSRAWGFPSPDSDYDVRFIYRHPSDWYLTVNEKTDHIQFMEGELLDVSGWDIRKVLRLLFKSNNSIYSWLYSPMIYRQNTSFIKGFRALAEPYFLPKSVIFHFLGIATGMLQKEFQTDEVKIKKYFYVLRPVLAAKWICEFKSPPPILFDKLLFLVKDESVLNQIRDLLKRKETANEAQKVKRISILDEFVKMEMKYCEIVAKELPKKVNDYENINHFYRKILGA